MSPSLLFDVCIISAVDHIWKCSQHNAVQLCVRQLVLMMNKKRQAWCCVVRCCVSSVLEVPILMKKTVVSQIPVLESCSRRSSALLKRLQNLQMQIFHCCSLFYFMNSFVLKVLVCPQHSSRCSSVVRPSFLTDL